MSLDRGWFDALLDDSGDGLSGSVWDKADIKALLDSVDAELARLDGGWITYTPGLYATTGAWSSTAAVARYRMAARACTLLYSIEASTLTAGTARVRLALPSFGTGLAPGTVMATAAIFVNGAYEVGVSEIVSPFSMLDIARLANLQFPAGAGLYVRGQITYQF